MSFTKESIRDLHIELDKVLKAFAEANGVTVGASRFRYSETEAKVEFALGSEANGTVDPRFLLDLKRRGREFGLTEEMIDRTCVVPNRGHLDKFTFLGMKASKSMMKCERDGKTYSFDSATAARYLKDVK